MRRSSPKAACGLATRAREGLGDPRGLADHAHALAAAARRRLDEHRVADPLRRERERRVGAVRILDAGNDRDAQLDRETACRGLVAHGANGVRRRPDPGNSCGFDGGSEVGVLGEKPEPWVHGIGHARLRRQRRRRSTSRRSTARRTVGRRFDRDDAEPVARSADPPRDLTAVGDEQPPDRPGSGGLSGVEFDRPGGRRLRFVRANELERV